MRHLKNTDEFVAYIIGECEQAILDIKAKIAATKHPRSLMMQAQELAEVTAKLDAYANLAKMRGAK